MKVYRTGRDGEPVRVPSSQFLDQPSVTGTAYDWIFTCMCSALLWGNAWGLITSRSGITSPNGFGYPTSVEWLPPDRVSVQDDPEQPENPLRAMIYYNGRLMDRENLVQVKAFPVPGKVEGISPLRAFATLYTQGLHALDYSADWFKNGGFPPGVFKNNVEQVNSTQAAEIRRMLTDVLRARQPLVIGSDWEYTPVHVPPNEAVFVQAMQLNATQVAAIYGLPAEKAGGTRGSSLTYNCVARDTEILTTRGWLSYDQVRAGDTCLTLNADTGVAEWQPVQGVHIFGDGPYDVIRMENRTHSSVTTSDHRWPVMIMGREKHLPGYDWRGEAGWQWRTTETMPTDARIAAAAPYSAPAEQKWSDAFVQLMAWFWTEGWAGPHGSVTIAQSDRVNPANVTRIRAALTEVFGPEGELQVRSRPSWREDRDEQDIIHFRLNALAGRQLLAQAPGKVISTEFLAQLTAAQLELFYQVSIDADGFRRPDGTDGTVIAQKDRGRLEAFQVACALTGRAGVIRGPNSRGMYHMSIRVRPWVTPKRHRGHVSRETADLVWCVSTPNKTWFARRNGTCYFTGNTVVQETISLITDTLRPWLMRLEALFTQLLPGPQYVRFDTDSLLKTDLKTRNEIYQLQRNMGTRTADEIRGYDDLPPLPDGVGKDPLPQSVLDRMAASTRAIPKSLFGQLILEQDLAAQLLQKLQAEGLAPPLEPGKTPVLMGPEAYLGHQITLARQQPAGAGQEQDTEGRAQAAAPALGLWPASQGGVRATSGDRDRAVRLIKAAAAAGCLTGDEIDQRLCQASKPGITRGVLNEITRDLPPENELFPPRPQAGAAPDPVPVPSHRGGDGAEQPMFGPAAMALLYRRAMETEREERLSAVNGTQH